jgi:hypothetical protein
VGNDVSLRGRSVSIVAIEILLSVVREESGSLFGGETDRRCIGQTGLSRSYVMTAARDV